MFLFERKLVSLRRDTEPRTYVNKLFCSENKHRIFTNIFSEVNFYKVVLIFLWKYLEIYTKTISRLRFGDYKPIFTSPKFGSVNIGL